MKNISAAVKVTLQVEVHVGSWAPQETFEGLREQAIREAKAKLHRLIDKNGCRIVGEPKSMSVVLEGEL